MKLLICGCRKYEDNNLFIQDILDSYLDDKDNLIVIEGGGTGVDEIAKEWARTNYVACLDVPADWGKYKKSAGPKRNTRMITYFRPDKVLAFPSKSSIGTWDTFQKAKDAGIPYEVYEV